MKKRGTSFCRQDQSLAIQLPVLLIHPRMDHQLHHCLRHLVRDPVRDLGRRDPVRDHHYHLSDWAATHREDSLVPSMA